MTASQLQILLSKLYNKESAEESELFAFVEHMYKNENPDKVYDKNTVEKLFSINQLLQMVLNHYVSLIENNPTEYGLHYLRIYNKDSILIKTTVTEL